MVRPLEPHLMLRLISYAYNIIEQAGREVRRITKSGVLGVVDKGVHDYQTEADRFVQRLIVSNIARKYPKITIVGEEDLADVEDVDGQLIVNTHDYEIIKSDLLLPEDYPDIKEEEITVWVDPLDGTTEFVNGLLEHVTILIGISVGGKSTAGIIHQPFHGYEAARAAGPVDIEKLSGRTMWGLVGVGLFGEDSLYGYKRLTDDKLIITTTASHGNVDIEESLAALKPDEVLKIGGAGYKVLLVLEGRAHSYVFSSNGCKRWDTCAPEALLVAAGGRLTTVMGDQIEYKHRPDNDYKNYLGIVASAKEKIHQKVIAKIPDCVKERLKAAQPGP